MKARIYKPAKTAMQSGTGRTQQWVLEFEKGSGKQIDPLMGWTGSRDMQQQVKLTFDSVTEAEAYAARNGIEAVVAPSRKRKRIIRSYAENFK